MNYIHQLQADLCGHIAAIESMRQSMRQFQSFLNGPKFTGTDNGERKDWIATADVLHWLRESESAALVAGDHAKANWTPPPKPVEQCLRCGCTESLSNGLCSDCNCR